MIRPASAVVIGVGLWASIGGCSLAFGDNLDVLRSSPEGEGGTSATDGGGVPGDASGADVVLPDGDVIAPDVPTLGDLKVADSTLVWSTATGVYACDKASCAASAHLLAAGSPTGLAIEEGLVYWANVEGTTLESCALGGCGGKGTVVRSGLSSPHGPASDGTSLYYTTVEDAGARTAVYRCPRASCAAASDPSLFTVEQAIEWLAARPGALFFVELRDTTATLYMKTPSVSGFRYLLRTTRSAPAVIGDEAYYARWDNLLMQIPAVDGTNAEEASKFADTPKPERVAANASIVAWTDSTAKRIYACPRAGCSPSPVIVLESDAIDAQSAIAVDGAKTIYARVGGAIAKLSL